MMQIGVIGINHRSRSLLVREQFARAFQSEFDTPTTRIPDSVLLLTCNRVELYFSSDQLASTHAYILQRLNSRGLSATSYALYSYFGKECFFHLGRVITGMDSAIFGESEIQRQVKLAYERRRKQTSLRHDLHYLFQKALKTGKALRNSYLAYPRDSELPRSIEKTTSWLGTDLKTASILLVGYSRLNRTIASFLQAKGCRALALCTRAQTAHISGVAILDWTILPQWQTYDVVICATQHSTYVLKEGKGVKRGKNRTLLFDLGVPRNVDPALSYHPSVYLCHLSQLEKLLFVQEEKHSVALCSQKLETIVLRQMMLFTKRRQAKDRYLDSAACAPHPEREGKEKSSRCKVANSTDPAS